MADLERAIAIAVEAHRGQVDKVGAPYILHPLRVMFAVEGDDAKIAAVLHDVVEDTRVTLDDLRREGFSEPILAALALLTHGPDDPYETYIEQLKSNPLARAVKKKDLEDNMDIRRIDAPREHDFQRCIKYRKAWDVLRAADGGGGHGA